MRTFRLSWEHLGWWPVGETRTGRSPPALPGAKPGERVGFLVVAPWCEDCQELAAEFSKSEWAKRAQKLPGRTWLVGEFASAESVVDFAPAFAGLPVLQGTTQKSEEARSQAGFTAIRKFFGDSRTWGLPTWLEAELQPDGTLHFTGADAPVSP